MAGPLDAERRLYVVPTHSGITLAPLLGRIAVAMFVTGDTHATLAPFRPYRFATGEADPALPRLVRTRGEQ